MDLKKAILKEHSRAQAVKIADYVGVNKALFKRLVELYLAGPYRITQRASWPLTLCVERRPSLVQPFLKRILTLLETPDVHPAVKRNTMRLLSFTDIPSKYVGQAIDLGFRFLQHKKETVAVKVFSMMVVHRLVAEEPDLKKELQIILEDQLPYGSPAFVSRARKVLKEISRAGRV